MIDNHTSGKHMYKHKVLYKCHNACKLSGDFAPKSFPVTFIPQEDNHAIGYNNDFEISVSNKNKRCYYDYYSHGAIFCRQ